MICGQKGCEEEAVFSYTWPSNPDRLYACEKHYQKAFNVSRAMGFRLGDVRREDPGDAGDLACIGAD